MVSRQGPVMECPVHAGGLRIEVCSRWEGKRDQTGHPASLPMIALTHLEEAPVRAVAPADVVMSEVDERSSCGAKGKGKSSPRPRGRAGRGRTSPSS